MSGLLSMPFPFSVVPAKAGIYASFGVSTTRNGDADA